MNSILIVMFLFNPIVLFSIISYEQAKSEEASYRFSPQTYFSNDSVPPFYIVLPENMPDSELNPTPAVKQPDSRSDNDLRFVAYLLFFKLTNCFLF